MLLKRTSCLRFDYLSPRLEASRAGRSNLRLTVSVPIMFPQALQQLFNRHNAQLTLILVSYCFLWISR